MPYPPMIKYCRENGYWANHFYTLDVKTLRTVWCNIWRVTLHTIFLFNICDECNCCFKGFFLDTVLLKSSGNSVKTRYNFKFKDDKIILNACFLDCFTRGDYHIIPSYNQHVKTCPRRYVSLSKLECIKSNLGYYGEKPIALNMPTILFFSFKRTHKKRNWYYCEWHTYSSW